MDELQKIAYYLHTMLCSHMHATDMNEIEDTDLCCFYLEETMEDSWSFPTHKIWKEEAETFIEISQPFGSEDVLRHMNSVLQVYEGFKAADIRLASYIKRIFEKGEK